MLLLVAAALMLIATGAQIQWVINKNPEDGVLVLVSGLCGWASFVLFVMWTMQGGE